jgi:hypothetical protein
VAEEFGNSLDLFNCLLLILLPKTQVLKVSFSKRETAIGSTSEKVYGAVHNTGFGRRGYSNTQTRRQKLIEMRIYLKIITMGT